MQPVFRSARLRQLPFDVGLDRARRFVVPPDVVRAGIREQPRDIGAPARCVPDAPVDDARMHGRPFRDIRNQGLGLFVAFAHAGVPRFRVRLGVEEQRDEFDPLGSPQRRRVDPIGVVDHRGAGRADHVVRIIGKAGGHQDLRLVRDDDLRIDAVIGREHRGLARFDAGIRRLGADELPLRHAGQPVERADDFERGQMGGRGREDAFDRHLDHACAADIIRRRRTALDEDVFDGIGPRVGFEHGHPLIVIVVTDDEVLRIEHGCFLWKIINTIRILADTAPAHIGHRHRWSR